MTIADLILEEPDPTFGVEIQRPASSGVWRFALELADPSAGDYAEWFDITEFYAGDRYQRGADEYMGVYRAAVAQVELQTDDDALAPWGADTTPLFGVNVELDAGLLMRLGLFRVVSAATVEWAPIWTGRVETWGDASAARGQIRTHVVTVVDTISDLVNVPTLIDFSTVDLDEWFDEVLTQGGWLYGVDKYGDDITASSIAADSTSRSAMQQLDAGTAPFGLAWRSLRNGRMVIHPQPWDTTSTARYPNPLLDVYPLGLKFSYSPDFTDIEYIDDDDQQPFGITRTSLGVVNSIIATFPGPTTYAVDDPVSIDRYGTKPAAFTWIADNEPVVDDLLAARAYASQQALPLRTTLEHEGFWAAMSIVDHLDPVTIVHTSSDTGPDVTAVGTVRNITEERTIRDGYGGIVSLSWQSTLQVDITSSEVTAALLPVEDLALVSTNSPLLGGPSSAEFSWTNPTQPDVTPTEVQLRVLGRSLIWFTTDYPGVGADGIALGWLEAATPYTLQVRLARTVDGVTTHVSAIRELEFTTPALILPLPDPDGTDTNVIVGEPPGFDCELEVELQENDGTGWVTIDTFTDAELVDNGDGTWSLATPIDNAVFETDKIYRFRSREVCEGTPGDWFTGPSFDPPDDWADPCTTPPALGSAPFTDADLLVYVPQVCAPDIIREAVSGIEGVKGDAFAGLVQMLGSPDYLALEAIPDPGWTDTPGGIVAYGECPQIAGETGDKTMAVKVRVAEVEDCVLFECAGMQIKCVTAVGGWRASAVVYKAGTTVTLPTTALLAVDTDYNIAATFELSTGITKIYVAGNEDNTSDGTDGLATIEALPIWRVGAPPESWITDCAVWSRVLAEIEMPGYVEPVFDPDAITGLALWHDASDTGTITTDANGVIQWDDKSGNSLHATSSGSSAPDSGTRTINSLNVIDFDGSNHVLQGASTGITITGVGGITIFAVIQQDRVDASSMGLMHFVNNLGTADLIGILLELRTNKYAMAWGEGETGSASGKEWTALHESSGSATTASARLITARLSTAAQTMRINGTAITLTSFATSGSPVFMQNLGGADLNNQIGKRSGTERYNGVIGEILVYDNALSDADRDEVEAYLISKWGL